MMIFGFVLFLTRATKNLCVFEKPFLSYRFHSQTIFGLVTFSLSHFPFSPSFFSLASPPSCHVLTGWVSKIQTKLGVNWWVLEYWSTRPEDHLVHSPIFVCQQVSIINDVSDSSSKWIAKATRVLINRPSIANSKLREGGLKIWKGVHKTTIARLLNRLHRLFFSSFSFFFFLLGGAGRGRRRSGGMGGRCRKGERKK